MDESDFLPISPTEAERRLLSITENVIHPSILSGLDGASLYKLALISESEIDLCNALERLFSTRQFHEFCNTLAKPTFSKALH